MSMSNTNTFHNNSNSNTAILNTTKSVNQSIARIAFLPKYSSIEIKEGFFLLSLQCR